jgi:hypothetical protein
LIRHSLTGNSSAGKSPWINNEIWDDIRRWFEQMAVRMGCTVNSEEYDSSAMMMSIDGSSLQINTSNIVTPKKRYSSVIKFICSI